MTIDEITTAIKEWNHNNENPHYVFLAVDGRNSVYGANGSDDIIAYTLAHVLRKDKVLADAISFAMRLANIKIFEDQDDDEE